MRISKPAPDQSSYQSCLLENSNPYRQPHYTKTTFSLKQLFAIPHFDTETEQLFWQERHLVLLTPLKWALCLGAMAFLAYLGLDLVTGNVKANEALFRLPMALLHKSISQQISPLPQATRRI